MIATEEQIEWSLDYDKIVIDNGDADPIELELEHRGDDLIEDSITIKRTEKGYKVGYLVYDEDCPSPEEADGVGYIGTSSRRDSRELNERYQEALGLNSDWGRKVSDDDILYEAAFMVWPNRSDVEITALLRDPEGEYKRENVKLPYRKYWDQSVEMFKKRGDLGDPDRVMLSVYEHGGRVYSVGDGRDFPDFMWDVASGGAVWVPDKLLREDEAKGLTGKKRREKMVEWAKQAVEQMNDWMNGNCYGVVTQEFTKDGGQINSLIGYSGDGKGGWHAIHSTDNACYGYIGRKWAEEELEMEMKHED